MADNENALAVAEILYHFVMVLVACRLLLSKRKSHRKYCMKPWLTTRTVHGAYRSLFNDLGAY